MLQETLICRNTNYHSTISSRFLRVVSRRFFCVYKDCKTFTNTLPLPLRDDSAFPNGVNILYTSTRELFLVLSVAINYNTKGAIVIHHDTLYFCKETSDQYNFLYQVPRSNQWVLFLDLEFPCSLSRHSRNNYSIQHLSTTILACVFLILYNKLQFINSPI